MDKELLKELAYQDEKLKKRIIGPNTKEFIKNLSSNYDLDAIKENIEQVNKKNSFWAKLADKSSTFYIIICIALTLLYWVLWGFFAGIFVGICSFYISASFSSTCEIVAGYNEQSCLLLKGYDEASSKDNEMNKKK